MEIICATAIAVGVVLSFFGTRLAFRLFAGPDGSFNDAPDPPIAFVLAVCFASPGAAIAILSWQAAIDIPKPPSAPAVVAHHRERVAVENAKATLRTLGKAAAELVKELSSP